MVVYNKFEGLLKKLKFLSLTAERVIFFSLIINKKWTGYFSNDWHNILLISKTYRQ